MDRSSRDNEGITPRSWAVANSHWVVNLLLRDAGAAENIRGEDGEIQFSIDLALLKPVHWLDTDTDRYFWGEDSSTDSEGCSGGEDSSTGWEGLVWGN